MRFDMWIIKTKKQILENITKEYNQDNLDELPYEAFEKLRVLSDFSDSKSFTTNVNILSEIEGRLPCANNKCIYLSKENYELMMNHCEKKWKILKQIQSTDFLSKKMECGEYERFFYWLKYLNPNWNDDIIIYGIDC